MCSSSSPPRCSWWSRARGPLTTISPNWRAPPPAEVAHFLASAKVQLPNAYRVLNADGSIPAEGMLNASYRGMDLRQRLAGEGVEFDADGQAARSSA